ncbi:MAG: hypothetical protein P1V97_15760, partial [Planctomycetota bacterium]|nr:hypothetical protein [Planctomycetota bacterium]
MLSLKDRKVAALLLNKGQLSREQLNECVGIQQRLEEPRSLASILVARRYITADRLKSVMNDAIKAQHVAKTNAYNRSAVAAAPGASRAPAPSATPEKGNWETDVEIGRLLVARRVITEQQARECLGLLQKLLPSRPNARLTQVILKRRYTSRDALRMILSEYEAIKARNEAAPSNNNGHGTNGHAANGHAANGHANGEQRNGHNNNSHGFFNSSNGSGIAPPPMAPPPPPPPTPLAGLGAPPPLASDPFASVKPKPRQDFDADQSAPFMFGSAEAPRATNPMFGSGLDAPMNPHDADKTLAPTGNFGGISPVHESQYTSGSGAFPGFGANAHAPQAGPNISNVPPPIQQPSFNLPDLPRNPSGPIPIIAPIPPMMGSGVAPAPMMGSGAMPPMMGSGVAPAPMMGSGAMPPMAPPPLGGPSPFASGAPNSQMPELMDDRMGFRTMDLDGGSAPPPMMGSGAMPPMAPMGNPMNPMASGPLMAPVAPNVMASGPMPGPMASGPMGNPMASGPMPGPMGSGMGFGAPSASQAP